MANPDLAFGALAKPEHGSAFTETKERAAARRAHERREMDAAKHRDERKCRVPRCQYAPQKPRVEACHKRDSHRGMGSDKGGTRTARKLIVTLCFIHHRHYDRGALTIEPQDAAKVFDGPCDYFWHGQHIGSEKRIGVSVMRDAR